MVVGPLTTGGFVRRAMFFGMAMVALQAGMAVRRATAGTTKIHLMAVASHERAPGAQVAVDGPAARSIRYSR